MDASHWNFLLSQKHNTVYIETKTKKNHQWNIFLLKHNEKFLKIDLKYTKYRNQFEIYQGIMSVKIT